MDKTQQGVEMSEQNRNLFFSHSPLDKDVLIKIKNEIIRRSGGSVNVFLSSDGQSIPLGTNWQKMLDQALENCKLMLVAVTPRSNDSKWIQFESGYAYAKGCRVIPFAYDGMTIDSMDPPLNRLQGFNLDCAEKFKNIIREINAAFGLTLNDEITDEEFENLLKGSNQLANKFYEHGVVLIRVSVPYYPNWGADYIAALGKLNFQCAVENNTIYANGLTIRSSGSNPIKITFDPSMLNAYSQFLNEAILQGSQLANIEIRLNYGNGFRELDIPEWITSRLIGTEISFSSEALVYRNCVIQISHDVSYEAGDSIKTIRENTYVALIFKDISVENIDLEHLAHVLSETGIIYNVNPS